jgi:TonB family protein
MKCRVFAFAATSLCIAQPAMAQLEKGETFTLHRDAGGCWASGTPGNTAGLMAAAGLDLAGRLWFRASGRDWQFSDGASYRIGIGVPSSPDRDVDGVIRTSVEMRGFVDAAGWKGIAASGARSLGPVQWSPALALYREEEATPFATIRNPYAGSGNLLQCLREVAKEDRGSGKPEAVAAVIERAALSADDYPAAALRAEEQGRVGVRLTVSAHGLPSACTVTESSGSAILDRTTCLLFERRARFTPARDAAGETTEGSFSTAVMWQLPEQLPSRPALPQPIRR